MEKELMNAFVDELPTNKENLNSASLYVSTRVTTPQVASLPSRVATEDGAELTVVREVANATYALPKARTYTAMLRVPRPGFVKRVPVEVEVYPASAGSVEVGMRPLETVGNTERYTEAALSVVDELAEIVAGQAA
jgi:hypothetical protein